MEDDTNIRMGTGPSRKALIDDAIKFMSLKQLRSASRAWAKNLKLMAFDDSSRSLQMSRADARLTVPWQAICTRCEYNVRQQTEHYCEQHGIRQKVSVNIGHDAVEIRDESIPGFICDGCEVNIGHAERFRCLDCAKKRDYCRRCIESEDSFCAKVSHFPAVCPHVSARYCRACLYNTAISPFPSSRKIRNLRLIRQSDFCSDEFASCSDFFAVSYSSKEGKGPFTYQVRDLDGGTRENRVPDRVLDRAVAFAQENGFRFFWIYQECVEVDDIAEKTAALEGLDLVFSRADLTIGLLDKPLTSLAQLVSLSRLYQWNIKQESRLYPDSVASPRATQAARDTLYLQLWNSSIPGDTLDFLDQLCREPFFRSDMNLQASYCANDKMCLLLPKEPLVKEIIRSLQGCDIVCEERSISEYTLDYQTVLHCVRLAKRMYGHYDVPSHVQLVAATIRDFKSKNEQRLARVVNWLDHHLMEINPKSPSVPPFGDFYDAQGCSAARAYTYLRFRHADLLSDRLSVLANMCRYEVRLDLTNRQAPRSFTAAALAISIANGDLSLLPPEAYYSLASISAPLAVSGEEERHLWLPSNLQLANLSYREINSPIVQRPSSIWNYGLAHYGLELPGILWEVCDTPINLSSVQKGLADSWFNLRFWTSFLERDEGVSLELWVNPWLERLERLPAEVRDRLEPAKLVMEWMWDEEDGVEEYIPNDIDHLRRSLLDCYQDILLSTILWLRDSDQTPLANAVWNSVQGMSWRMPGKLHEKGDVPRLVDDFPAHDSRRDTNSQIRNRCGPGLFQLDESQHGGFLHDWLVDRIMFDGKLWYGCPVLTTGRPLAARAEVPGSGEHRMAGRGRFGVDSKFATLISMLEGKGVYETSESRAPVTCSSSSTRGERGDVANGDSQSPGSSSGLRHGNSDETPDIQRRSAIRDSLMKFFDGHDEIHEFSAFFDVSGPCHILTPFEPLLEMMPRPALRGMSRSWIVVPMSDHKDIKGKGKATEDPVFSTTAKSHSKSEIVEHLRAKGQVKSMCPAITTILLNQYCVT